ncbi:hypothetical protein BGX31_007785, partial [Mortierella sp. GBA43]
MSVPPPQDATIALLQDQLANITRQLERLQSNKDSDPQLEEQAPITIYHPSPDEAKRCPTIISDNPLSFFQNDVPDDDFWEHFRRYPKNATRGYEPPKVPSVIHLSAAQKAHDQQLRGVQKRLVHITRPVDLFVHQICSMEGSGPLDSEDVVELCTAFANLMHEQLAAAAGRINAIRMDNLRNAQGANYKPDNLDIVEPSKFQEEIKSIRAITNAFKPRQPQYQQQRNGNQNYDRQNS